VDKQLILSVAGSGKTSYIVDRLDSSSKALILTYTDNNYINIRRKILEKLEVIPPGVKVFKYFNFLYTFCYRPFLRIKLRAKGFNFNSPPSFTFKLPRKNLKFYLDTNSQLYHNRVSKLLEEYNLLETINERISKYFQNVYIDEVQDFGGHDFNLLVSILKANTNITLVGDFFQHTYDTSKDGRVNSSLYDDEKKYIKIFRKMEPALIHLL
jgi:DNA helicase-2/ATP-dependent DNA helicase PcrA